MRRSSRERVRKAVLRAFSKDFVVASNPDLPHLFAVPDFLIGGHGRLSAIFCLKESERYRPSPMLFRLLLSRLGLPDMASILIDDAGPRGMSTIISSAVDAVVQSDDMDTLASILYQGEIVRKIPRETRETNAKRYAEALVAASQTRRTDTSLANPMKLLDDVRTRGQYWPIRAQPPYTALRARSASIQIRENVTVSAESFGTGRSPLELLRRHAWTAFMNDFSVDEGIPFFTRPRLNVLLVDRMPEHRLDPKKPARASAFAGMILIQASHVDEVEKISEQLDSVVRKSLL